MNTIQLTKENLHYVAKKQGNVWNGSFDGGDIEKSIDNGLKNYVRIGVIDEEVLFFKKVPFKQYLKSDSKIKQQVCLAELEWISNNKEHDEYEIFFDCMASIVTEFSNKCIGITFYINAFDFIRDTLLELAYPMDEEVTLIEDQNMIERLASYLFEENYDDINEYCAGLSKSTGIEITQYIGSVSNTNGYEDFIADTLRYEMLYYGRKQLISHFDEKLDRITQEK